MSLFGFERRWLLTIFATIYPSGADERLPIGATDVPVPSFIDELWRFAPTETLLGVRLATWLVQWSPLWTIRRLGGFASLSESDRTRVLERIAASNNYVVRELGEMLKMLGAFPYAGHEAVQRAVGVPPRIAVGGADA